VHEKRDSAKAEAFKRNFLGILKQLPVTELALNLGQVAAIV